MKTVIKKRNFMVDSDLEILSKLQESEDNYKKTGISYTFEESYKKWLDFINKLISQKNV